MTVTQLAISLQPVLHFFIQGGVFMIFLLLLSIIALAVIILRGQALREAAVLPPALVREIQRLEPEDNLDNLQRLIAAHPSPLARILALLLRQLSWPKSEVVEAVQTQARHEIARLESGLVILEISTGVAPLLGLLGTLSGLVGIFANLGGGGDPVKVAQGIAEALNTTIVGLAVAAPSLTAYNYFQRKIEVMSVEMESLVGMLLSKCYPQGEAPTIVTLDKK